VGLIVAVIATSIAGILSNPLFNLADQAVVKTAILQPSLASNQVTNNTVAVTKTPMLLD